MEVNSKQNYRTSRMFGAAMVDILKPGRGRLPGKEKVTHYSAEFCRLISAALIDNGNTWEHLQSMDQLDTSCSDRALSTVPRLGSSGCRRPLPPALVTALHCTVVIALHCAGVTTLHLLHYPAPLSWIPGGILVTAGEGGI